MNTLIKIENGLQIWLLIILVLEDFREIVPALLPFYHIYGLLSLAIASLYYGGKVVTVPKFEPAQFISTITKYKVNTTPVFILLLIWLDLKLERKHPQLYLERLDQHSIMLWSLHEISNVDMAVLVIIRLKILWFRMCHLNVKYKRDSLVKPTTRYLQANYQFLVNWKSEASASQSVQATCHITACCANCALWSPRPFPKSFQHGGGGAYHITSPGQLPMYRMLDWQSEASASQSAWTTAAPMPIGPDTTSKSG
jgi:hypothetical protein